MDLLLLAPASGIVAILFAAALAFSIRKMDAGTEKMQEIAGAIREGSIAYLKRQYKAVAVFAVIIAIAFAGIGALTGKMVWYGISISFLAGVICSALAGFVGMMTSVTANVRTAQAAKKGLARALKIAFRGGSVTGFMVVGLGILGVSGFYILFNGELAAIIGFGFGASLMALFARVGGGIYTKAADVGADLVGKIEKKIPEDDPRNAGVIADNVGDNVGDCAGMGADLFESYAVTMIAGMILGGIFSKDQNVIIFPLMIGAVAIFASIIGTFFVRLGKKENIMGAMDKGVFATGAIAIAALFFLTNYLFGRLDLFYALVVGFVVALLMMTITEYYTSAKRRPVLRIAKASQTGPGTNIIAGLAVGLKSTRYPVLIICAGILFSFFWGGVYGIAIAAMAMLSLTGIIVAVDSYGPITDNAGGIAEMSGLGSNIRNITDKLDAVGNTTKAVTKGFAIGSAALAALSLFAAYVSEIETARAAAGITIPFVLDIMNPLVTIGLFIGGMLPFLFSAYCMHAVGNAAMEIVNEVRRQFKEIPGLMQGKAKPDYARCVDICTKAAQKELIKPALIAVAAPIAVGFILGPAALGGFLAGVIITGLLLALLMTTGGAAWDNAKKYIESGYLGGKGTEVHAAAVVGDTVGDPFKDTAGPSMNPLIKVVNMIALIFASLFVLYALV